MKKIKVTKAHIKRGKRGTSDWCPIALAVRRAYFYPSVYGSWFCHGSGAGRRVVQLPDVAREFIRRFDAGEDVAPFEFEVDEA